MALQADFTDSNTNITTSDAYFRVAAITGDQEGFRVVVDCWFNQATRAFHNAPDPADARLPMCTWKYEDWVVDLDSNDNIFTQIYDYLKTLPEFAGYTDV